MKIKNASDLKYAVEQSGLNSHFFTRSTMKFFGDSMKNYGIRQPREMVKDSTGEKVMVYELTRKHPVKCGLQSSAYFDASSFARVFVKGGN